MADKELVIKEGDFIVVERLVLRVVEEHGAADRQPIIGVFKHGIIEHLEQAIPQFNVILTGR